MFAINKLKEDMAVVEKMLAVVEDFTDGREFRFCDIPVKKTINYRSTCMCGYPYKFEFNGASINALVRRGLVEIVGEEDYIHTWKDWKGNTHKKVNTRKIYKMTGKTIDDYKKIMARAIALAVIGE